MCTKLVLCVLINFLFVHSSAINNHSQFGELISTEGQLKIALILNECTLSNLTSRTYANSALWLTNRINALNFTYPLRLGLTVRGVCSDDEYYDSIFKVYKESSKFIFISSLASDNLPPKVLQFQNIIGVNFGTIIKHTQFAIEASIGLLNVLDFRNVTVYSDDRNVLQQFYELSYKNSICVQNGIIFGSNSTFDWSKRDHNDSVVVYADTNNLDHFLKNLDSVEATEARFIFVSSDTSEKYVYPEGSYIIQPIHLETSSMVTQNSNLVLSSLLFDLAGPVLQATSNISNFINENCNETRYKFNCLQNKHPKLNKTTLSPLEIVTKLQLTSFLENFVYKTFVVQNLTYSLENETTSILQSFEHIYTYKIFNKIMVNLETGEEIGLSPINQSETVLCSLWSNPPPESILRIHIRSHYRMRSEAWIYAFLAISVLGVLFSIAVLIFLVIRLCKQDILEGNPLLTVFLLLSVIMIYCAVLPFAVQGDGELKNSIILSRALSATLVYAFTFSLLLSRSILLATVSNDIGFMSHISGPVQSFLTLFIFGVQGALSLVLINHCEDIFKGNFFVYLMSYNVMLLVLLIFISPINSRVHRNYKEGKYFTVAVALIAFVWSCWIPVYIVFDDKWKDITVCSGLVATASILLCAIFIPRTYKMAVAAAKDRLTNAIPSLPSTSSIMDVYRASTQPIYDCINFAAVNAASITRNSIPHPPPQPQLYTSGNSQYEDDFNFENCISLRPSQDKVTRF